MLVERLAIYPAYIAEPEKWLDASLRPAVLRACDAEGFARADGLDRGRWQDRFRPALAPALTENSDRTVE